MKITPLRAVLPLDVLPCASPPCVAPACARRSGSAVATLCALLLAACGGGGGSSGGNGSNPGPASGTVQVSATSTLGSSCGTATGSAAPTYPEAYTPDSAVQPQLAADPANNLQLYGVWEQDRWNAIGARAISFSASGNGGDTWGAISTLPFSKCAAASGPAALYDRASDPSIAVGMGKILYASALAFSAGGYLANGGSSAVLVTRSTDGGATWASASSLVADTGGASGPYYFNDRDAVAADPASSHVYVVWDTINNTNGVSTSQPTWLAHSANGGQAWDAARVIFDPGLNAFGGQTFNNQPQVLPDGSVVVVFTLFNGFGPYLSAIRSTDHGTTWSGAYNVAPMSPVGTANPIAGGPPIRDSINMAQTAVDPVNGTLAAVWQEGSFSGGARDAIALVLSHDAGQTWSAPVAVNTVPSVAAFNPSVRFGAGGRIAVTYYDFRDYVGGSGVLSTGLWLRESSDGGASWTEKRLAGPFDLNRAPPADQIGGTTGNALFLGDQQGLAWNGYSWTALYAATSAAGARVYSGVTP